MSLPGFLRAQQGAVCLSIKLQPRASKNEIGEAAGDELKVKVTAPPVDSAANDALLRLLAETLGCPRGAVQLVRGRTSRHKQVLVQGMSVESVAAKLLRG
jgi:hypothetical protein